MLVTGHFSKNKGCCLCVQKAKAEGDDKITYGLGELKTSPFQKSWEQRPLHGWEKKQIQDKERN